MQDPGPKETAGPRPLGCRLSGLPELLLMTAPRTREKTSEGSTQITHSYQLGEQNLLQV